jgi:molybdopterin molybdotransferase
MERAFYKVAMRPGKPLMAGRMNGAAMVGLPGNPVSAMVCARLFLLPAIERLLGLAGAAPRTAPALLAAALPANGPRTHYMRATLETDGTGGLAVRAVDSQDSSLLSRLSGADALIVRPPHAPPAAAGERVPTLRIRADDAL